MTLMVSRVGGARVVGSRLTVAGYGRLYVVVFATRYGTVFDESKLVNGWTMIDRVKAQGSWFSGGDWWFVVVAKLMGPYNAASYPETVTEHVDADGLDPKAPLRCEAFTDWTGGPGVARSVFVASGVLSGYLERVPPLTVPGLPAGSDSGTCTTSLIAMPGPHYLQSGWEKTYGWPQFQDRPESDGYEAVYFRKWRQDYSWHPVEDNTWWLVGKATVEWPGASGTTSERKVWYGDTTQVQQLAVALSAAAPRPTRPVLDLPANHQWMDPTKPWRLGWASRSDLAGAQTQVQVRRTRGTEVRYRDVAAQTWTTAQATNTTALPYVDFPALAFEAYDRDFTIEVRVKGATGDWSDWSTATLVSTAAPPSVSVTLPDAVASVVPTLTPRVSVTGDGTLPLVGYAVAVHVRNPDGSLGVLVEQAEVEGMSEWVAAPLTNGGEYTLRARTYASGGAASDWAEVVFTVDAPVPGAPTVRAEQIDHETSGAPGVGVLVDWPWDTDEFEWAYMPVTLHVERTADDGASWAPVGHPEPLTGSAAQYLRDWYLPHGEYRYRVKATARLQSGGLIEGAWGESGPVRFYPDGSYLVPDGRPDLAVRVCWVSEGTVQHGSGGKADARLGSPFKMVSYGSATAPSRQLTVRTETAPDHDRLLAVLQSKLAVWLLDYARRGRDGRMQDARGRWLRVVDVIEDAPLADRLPLTLRNVTFRAEEQPSPFEAD